MNIYILVTNSSVEANDEFIFLRSEVSSLKIRSEVINPSESATFTTSSQACICVVNMQLYKLNN
jgi:hypothetical protein